VIRSAGPGVAVVEDRAPRLGPLAGVEAALAHLEGAGVERAFFLPVDSPNVSFELIAALWEGAAAAGARGCVPRWSRGLEPAHAVYATALLGDVRRLLDAGEIALEGLARLPGVQLLDLEDAAVGRRVFGASPPDLAEVFRNLNRPEEYEEWVRPVDQIQPP
jgi:molybdopterin-guanine dinucleotide biosynthesis protein A